MPPRLALDCGTSIPGEQREKLSVALRRLAEEFAEKPMDFAGLVHVTQDRAYDVLLIFLTLPFLTPIPIPFLSSLLGSVIVLIGGRLALGQRPWLPQRLLQHKIEGRNLIRLLNAGSRVIRGLEVFLRPRLGFVHTGWVYRRVTGSLIAVSGALLLLPLPIPLSNALPAATVLLLAAGALERDGVFFFAGCAAFALTTAFFGGLVMGGAEAVDWAMGWFTSRRVG